EAGLEQEARSLYPFRSANALNTVGYREWFDYFDGKTDRQSAIELIKRNTRQYARKQLTWFRRDPEINWFDTENCNQIIPFIESKISEYESAR
ncbi:MAG TPA: tRNA dimethylallyltransferase, partial [Prolixibacteraceae bacterium]|nr:tRNA dimethylallyltransferase [Prolixibacteraceae bacterium]